MNELEKMNELERIREDFASQPCNEMHSKYYKEGFNDAIELNLPVLFIEWWCALTAFYKGFYSDKKKAYDYWINNIYGK